MGGPERGIMHVRDSSGKAGGKDKEKNLFHWEIVKSLTS